MLGKTRRILGAAAVAGLGVSAALTATASADQWAKGTVEADGGLVGHIAPSRHAADTYTFKNGSEVTLNCMTKGTAVAGNTEWYLVAAEGEAKWISAEFVAVHGKEPEFCGSDVSTSVTLAKDVTSRQGPSTADANRRTMQAGDGQEAVCFTYTGPAASKKWVVTLEDGWIPGSSLKSTEGVPYCEH